MSSEHKTKGDCKCLDIDSDLSVLDRFYTENAESYRYFLEWRHKILVRYFFIIGAALILIKGVLDYRDELPNFILLIPPMIVTIGSLASYGMDRRNAMVTGNATIIGKNLESEMIRVGRLKPVASSPFYTKLSERENEKFTYTNILKIMYLSTFVAGLIITLIIALRLICSDLTVNGEQADCIQALINPKQPRVVEQSPMLCGAAFQSSQQDLAQFP